MAQYQILVQAIIDRANLQQQLNQTTATKPINIPLNVDTNKLTNQIQLWENSLAKMQIRAPEAFATTEVQAQVTAFRGLIDQYSQGLIPIGNVRVGLDNVRVAMAQTTTGMRDLTNNGFNLNSLLEATAKKFIIWGVLMTSIYSGLSQIKSGIQYITDMNKELTTTAMIMDVNTKDMQGLIDKYQKLAVQLGSTTLEVAKGAETWIRQGKSIEDATKLLEVSTMMSKMSGDTAENTSTYLTAILNGFQLNADQAMTILDKMTVLANSSRTSAAVSIGELSTALEKSSNVALQAGISYDQLLSYISTISTVTRKSADEIGTSFQAILARMENVKAGFTDEEGQTINNVETVLNRVGIALRDSNGQFRSMADVIDEVAKKFKSLDSIEQSQVVTAIAGVRQRQNLLALLENYNMALQYQAEEANSAGQAQDRYGKYLDNVEAAQNRLTDAWNKLATVTTNSGFIKWFIDAATAIVNFTANIGGIVPVLVALAGALFLVKSVAIADFFVKAGQSIMAIIPAIFTLGTTITGVGAAITASLGIIGIVIAVGVAAYNLYKSSVDQTATATKDLDQEITKLQDDISLLNSKISEGQNQVSQLKDLFEQYQSLGNAVNLTGQNLRDYYDIQNKIKDILPQVAGSYDDEGNFILREGTNLETLLKLKQDEININETLYQQDQKSLAGDLFSKYQKDAQIVQDAKDKLAKWGKALATPPPTNPTPTDLGIRAWEEEQERNLTDFLNTNNNAVTQVRSDVNKIAIAYEGLDPVTKKLWMDMFLGWGDAGKGIIDYITKMELLPEPIAKVDDILQTMLPDLTTFGHVLEKCSAALKLLSDALDKEQSSLANLHPTLVTLVSDYQKTGILTDDMIETLKKSFPDTWYKALVEVNGQYQLSIPLLKQLEIATYQKAVADAQAVISQAKVQQALIDSDLATQNQILATDKLALSESNGSESAISAAIIKIQATEAIISGLMAEKTAIGENIDAYKAALQEAENALAKIQGNAFTPLPDSKAAEQAAKQLQDYYNTILKDTEDMLKQQANDRKQALQDELDGYKKIIDAEKSLLDEKEQELEYQEELADKTSNLSKIDDQLLALQFDNSQEGIAKRLELEDQKAKAIKDINDTERKHSVEEQKKALDKEYDDFKTIIDKKIKDIDDYLKKTGLIEQEAIKLLESHTDNFYQSLITWNDTYNNSIKDLQVAWDAVFNAKQQATGTGTEDHQSNYTINPTNLTHRNKITGKEISDEEWRSLPAYDSGGIVGGLATSQESNQYAKLLKGEVVATEGQIYSFLHNTLPRFISMGSNMGSNINIDMPIHVAGNLDKSVLPDLKNMITDTLNKALYQRGIRRDSFSFSV